MPLKFSYMLLADISKAEPEFSVINATTWDDGDSAVVDTLQFFYKLTSPEGIVIFDSGVSPFQSGLSETGTPKKLPGIVPQVNGHMEWGGDGYQVTGYVLVNGAVPEGFTQEQLTQSYTFSLCRPKGNSINSTDNFGAMRLAVRVVCKDPSVMVEEKSDYIYQGIPPFSGTMKLRLIRPADTPDDMPTAYDRTTPFGILKVPLFKDGEGYQLLAESVRDYLLQTNVIVRIRYTFRTKFDVLCAIDMCSIIKAVDRMREDLRKRKCAGDDLRTFNFITSDLALLYLVQSEPLCGVDPQPIIARLIADLGSYYVACPCDTGLFATKTIANEIVNAGSIDKQEIHLNDSDVEYNAVTGEITCPRIVGFIAAKLQVTLGTSPLYGIEYFYNPEGTFALTDKDAYATSSTLIFYGPKNV